MITATPPRHVAIIMDGNGRWAKQRGLPRLEGHRAGLEAARKAITFAVQQGIEVLTLFALSVENYIARPKEEVQFLLSLLLQSLQNHLLEIHNQKIRVRIIGECDALDIALRQKIQETETLTADNTGLTLVLAINYSGRWDILQAAKRFALDVNSVARDQRPDSSHWTEDQFARYLCLSDFPEPDLLIRSGGELRISNFMLWQFAYTEFFFLKENWPDFEPQTFQRALHAYAQRERRFGLSSEQLERPNA